MTGERRSRFSIYVFLGAAILGLGGLAVSLATRSVAGMTIALTFTTVFGIVWIGDIARRRGVVPAHLQGLELDQRRLVSAAVDCGAACPTPCWRGPSWPTPACGSGARSCCRCRLRLAPIAQAKIPTRLATRAVQDPYLNGRSSTKLLPGFLRHRHPPRGARDGALLHTPSFAQECPFATGPYTVVIM